MTVARPFRRLRSVLAMVREAGPVDDRKEDFEYNPAFNPRALDTAKPPTQRLALVAIMKDEADYLPEWLHFHLMLGVDHLYLYDNGSTDGTEEIAAAHTGSVTVLPWPHFITTSKIQHLAYKHALASFGAEYRWMAFLDADEFVFPAFDDSIPDVLAGYEDLPGVVLPWHMFGMSGHDQAPQGLVIESYTQRARVPFDARGIDPRIFERHAGLLRGPNPKTIVDPRQVRTAGIHHFLHKSERHTAMRELWTRDGWRPDERDPLVLNHYFTKSRQEFEARVARGTPSSVPRAQHYNRGALRDADIDRKRYLAMLIDRDPVTDLRIQRHVEPLKRELQRCPTCGG